MSGADRPTDASTGFWERAFGDKQLMWGLEPTLSAVAAAERFSLVGARDVLIPGIGYGRNATPFLERGMTVTGIEIAETAIALARSRLGLTIPIHHGSVSAMPFDDRLYDGIFCHGVLHLLDAGGRAKLLRDCHRQLAPGGHMVFTTIAKTAPMYGQGARLGEDWYERLPGLPMYFHGPEAVDRDFGPHGIVDVSTVEEPGHGSLRVSPIVIARLGAS